MLPRIVALIFLALGGLHFYWAGGGRWAAAAAIPQLEGRPLFVPGKWTTVAAGLLFVACAGLVLARAQGMQPATWLCYGLASVLLLRAIGDFRYVGFFKCNRGSRFAELDTRLYSPACLALAAGVYWVARG